MKRLKEIIKKLQERGYVQNRPIGECNNFISIALNHNGIGNEITGKRICEKLSNEGYKAKYMSATNSIHIDMVKLIDDIDECFTR